MEKYDLYIHELKQNYQNIGLASPFSASFEITRLCNLSCDHCYNKGKQPSRQKCYSLSDKKNVIYKLKELGILEVTICGGEPFLDKDIIQIIEVIKLLGLRLVILTNGILLTAKIIKRLEMLMDDYDYIQLSIDDSLKHGLRKQRGLDENQNGALLSCLETLINTNINYIVNITPTVLNQNNLIELVHQLSEKGVKNITITPYVPMGGKIADDIKPDYKILADIEESIIGYTKNKEIKYGGGIEGHVCQSMIELKDINVIDYKVKLRECDAAKFNIHISDSGKIYPCVFMVQEEFLVGNIVDPVETIKKNLENIAKKISAKLPEKCLRCKILHECGGGCPGLIYDRYSRLDAVDPRCRR